MRVALVAPPFRGTARGLPLGLAYLASVLRNHDIDVCVVDMTVARNGLGQLEQALTSFRPDLIGLSAVAATYLEALGIARTCRGLFGPGVPLVFGGPHASAAAEEILSRHTFIDMVICGEAEQTLLEVCQTLAHS